MPFATPPGQCARTPADSEKLGCSLGPQNAPASCETYTDRGPAEFKDLSGDEVWGVFGFFSGMTLLVGLSGAVLVSIYTFFLNRVPIGKRVVRGAAADVPSRAMLLPQTLPSGGAHSFSWQFSHLLPLPVLNLVSKPAALHALRPR